MVSGGSNLNFFSPAKSAPNSFRVLVSVVVLVVDDGGAPAADGSCL